LLSARRFCWATPISESSFSRRKNRDDGGGAKVCGICGIALRDSGATPSESELKAAIERACDKLITRGNDERGVLAEPERGIALGHQRLSVIDLETGTQPMRDASGRWTIVFNGEIYNYEELRPILQRRGYVFRTKSDTEVLLYGLADRGVEFLSEANGMFAFALWDGLNRELLLGRDRFGVKPLYYAECAEGLTFASEAAAIEATGFVSGAIDQQAAALFLALSYIPGEQSIFSEIKRLGAGEWLRFRSGKIQRGKWWNLVEEWRSGATRTAAKPAAEWKDEFAALLSDAVKIRLKSDVPIGAFLSGGVDSATIAALMKRHSANVNTFTMRFSDKSHDESALAAQTAAALKTMHSEDLADASSADRLIKLAQNLDEPFADTSIIPTSALCEAAKKRVTVALSGDGADELLGGYVTNGADRLYARISRLPPPLVRMARAAVNLLPDDRRKVSAIFKLKQFFAAYPRGSAEAHGCWRLIFYPDALRELTGSALTDPLAPTLQAWNEGEGLNTLDRFLFVDYKTWLEDDILFKADRASMRFGLESRAPFLDYRLFNLCAAMPPELKWRDGKGKIILREVAAELLPPFVLSRPKRGFNAPVASWLTDAWRGIAEESFRADRVESAGLNPRFVSALWSDHLRRRKNNGFALFNVLMFLLWKGVRPIKC
jgi:asparagine synthase (glutamine-hydrolysing)